MAEGKEKEVGKIQPVEKVEQAVHVVEKEKDKEKDKDNDEDKGKGKI